MIHVSKKSRQPVREAWTRERLLYERSLALGSALDASSYNSYTSALNSYITFCKLHNLDADPTEDTLSFYTVFMSYHVQPRTVDSYLSGICNQLEPFFPRVREHRSSILVAKTLKGCKRLRSSPIRRRSPLLPSQIHQVTRSLSPTSSHDDVLFATLLLTGFHGLMRLGELCTHDTASRRDWRKISLRHTLSYPSRKSYSFILPTHKADASYEGNVILIQPFLEDLDPKPSFKRYVASRDRQFPLNPELWLTSAGTMPTRAWFIRRLRAFFPDVLIAGQSMRAGGATCLATTGALPAIIQAAGRWSSNTFQVYIRKNPFLLHAILRARHGHSASDS
jgi:hypothetical protein